MKKLIIVAAIASLTMLTGCKTATSNYKTGAYAGIAAYNGYTRICEKMPEGTKKEKFKKCVLTLWDTIDHIDSSTVGNNVVSAAIKLASEEVYNSLKADTKEKLSRDLATIKVIYSMYGKRVDEFASPDPIKQQAAYKWLLSFREGVRLMIQLDNGQIFAEYIDDEKTDYNVISPTSQSVINISQSVENIDKED